MAKALAAGYRHIDSATGYRNEQECVRAMAGSGIPRGEIFFTTKLPPRELGYEKTRAAIDRVLAQNPALGGYIDLYLIHAPFGARDDRLGQWRAMAEAQRAGKVRSLGVSNYGLHHLDELRAWQAQQPAGAAGVLSVGQWEVHPWLGRADIAAWCRREGVAVEAYSPLVRAQRMHEPLLAALAAAHGKTPAQILVRWSLQMGFVPLPKTTHDARIAENADVFDFELSDEDVARLDTGEYAPCAWDPTKEPL